MVAKDKYKAVILLLAKKINNQTLGKVKLMKLLYYLDFDFFEKYDRPITGDVYYNLPLGPVPRLADSIIKEMADEGSIKIVRQRMGGSMNERLLIVPLKEPDIQLLAREEIMMIEETACKWERFSGRDMTNASHGEAPWIATPPGQAIDYNLAYYRNKYNRMASM